MFRILLKIHRYLGIGLGVVVLLWCLSAFVMMYVQYPDVTDDEYLNGLQLLDLNSCCELDDDASRKSRGFDSFSIEMLAGRPTLRAIENNGFPILADLSTGQSIELVDQLTAKTHAQIFMRASGITGNAELQGTIDRDQWTVAGGFDRARPLFLFSAGDDAGTQLYVSTRNGKVVQVTNARERFWNWFGSVTHWIYPTSLRKNVSAWSQVVIWLSIASVFLVVVGLYLGIRQYAAAPQSSRSPYKGVTLWHHYSGLIFGLLTLTWLFSGLLSMNPWGILSGADSRAERQLLQHRFISGEEFGTFLQSLHSANLPADTVKIRSANLLGEFIITAYDRVGNVQRLDGTSLQPRAVGADTWNAITGIISQGNGVLDSGFIDSDDNYYFSHHQQVKLPVYRLIIDDGDQTRFYFDANTAELIVKIDGHDRWSRWLFLALHRGDFSALLRQRPLWDILLLTLLAGVTVGSATGLWLGVQRLRR